VRLAPPVGRLFFSDDADQSVQRTFTHDPTPPLAGPGRSVNCDKNARFWQRIAILLLEIAEVHP
jgi:hypothetical protein